MPTSLKVVCDFLYDIGVDIADDHHIDGIVSYSLKTYPISYEIHIRILDDGRRLGLLAHPMCQGVQALSHKTHYMMLQHIHELNSQGNTCLWTLNKMASPQLNFYIDLDRVTLQRRQLSEIHCFLQEVAANQLQVFYAKLFYEDSGDLSTPKFFTLSQAAA